MSEGNYNKILKQLYIKKKIKIYSHIVTSAFCTLKMYLRVANSVASDMKLLLFWETPRFSEVHLKSSETPKVAAAKPHLSQDKLTILSSIINWDSL